MRVYAQMGHLIVEQGGGHLLMIPNKVSLGTRRGNDSTRLSEQGAAHGHPPFLYELICVLYACYMRVYAQVGHLIVEQGSGRILNESK